MLGGGKALVAPIPQRRGAGRADPLRAPVDALELDGGRFVAADRRERIEARACVLAAGGFESNREWLRQAWGRNERGEWPADNFLIRGTRYNMGVLLKFMLDAGADAVGDRRNHCVAIDARAPLYDGGICTHRLRFAGRGGEPDAVASTTKAKTSGPNATLSGAG